MPMLWREFAVDLFICIMMSAACMLFSGLPCASRHELEYQSTESVKGAACEQMCAQLLGV
eukprot:2381438-Pleurochrysis_carterae.AAC.1